MAKRKSKKESANMAATPSMPERKSVETEEAENGFIVRVSHEGKHGYTSKRYIAATQPEAQRIAASGMRQLSSKKNSGRKKARKAKAFVSKKS